MVKEFKLEVRVSLNFLDYVEIWQIQRYAMDSKILE